MATPRLNPLDIAAIAAQVAALAGANATAQPGPKAARDLPTNFDGNPEFSNVILTLDHLQDIHGDDGHIRNKMVFSTESAAEVLAQLIAYYQVPLTTNALARVLEITSKAGESEYNGGIVVCYFPDGNPNDNRGPVVEVVLSTVTYDGLVRHPDFGKDSSLLASSALVAAVQSALMEQRVQVGPEDYRFPLLTYLQIHEADFPSEDAVEVRPATDFSGTFESRGAEVHPCEALSDIREAGTGASPRQRCYDAEAPNEITGGQNFTG